MWVESRRHSWASTTCTKAYEAHKSQDQNHWQVSQRLGANLDGLASTW